VLQDDQQLDGHIVHATIAAQTGKAGNELRLAYQLWYQKTTLNEESKLVTLN
jgi:hypothetical protein